MPAMRRRPARSPARPGLVLLPLGGLCLLVLLLGGGPGRPAAPATPPPLLARAPTPFPPAQLRAAPVDPRGNGFDPTAILQAFDYGQVSTLPTGQTLRQYTITARDAQVELAPGVFFAAWTYNGRIPGPTLRATEGDRLRITFRNAGTQPHSIHFHGIHPADQDGLEMVLPGAPRVYEFDAAPAGVQVYHCHLDPLHEHIQRGLYGVLIIDPRVPRPPAQELVMVMNAFDVNGDGENDIYAVNTVAFHYAWHPIPLPTNTRIRVYLANMTETDPVNSFHLHANFFDLFRTGTRATPDEYTDLVEMGEGERHILEFTYPTPGQYMFHAHQAEFSDKGWMGCFAAYAPGTRPDLHPCQIGAPAMNH